MSFDGLMLHSMITELKNDLNLGKITKIQNPYQNEIIISIRNHGYNHRLLISAHPSYARIQKTEIPYLNPKTPSNFCMLLRKHLEGARLIDLIQYRSDRIVFLVFDTYNELGDKEHIYLAIELMGKHSNIILLDAKYNIIDSIKHLSPSQNSYRTILPGVSYILPPTTKKINLLDYKEEELFALLATTTEFDAKLLQNNIEGLGRDTAIELATKLNQTTLKAKVCHDFIQKYNQSNPGILTKDNKEFLLPFPFESLEGNFQNFITLSEACDAFYGDKAERDRVNQQMTAILHRLHNEIKKNKQKLPKLEQTLQEADNAEILRQKGELLTTFLHLVPKGASSVSLQNYYEENTPISISLNPAYSPAKNAQKYFQRYQKLKKSVHIVKEQIDQTKQEITYLETLINEIELASPLELPFIREELIDQGYLKEKNKKIKSKKAKIEPLVYYSSDSDKILVGKNNLQNDQLTLRLAKKDYIWLHAKNIPGSHVIIENNTPSENTLLEAAQIAAYHSKYRNSAQVPVDYVAVKHVHKPNGAKPGFVIYKNQKTLFVTPDKTEIMQLQAQNKD